MNISKGIKLNKVDKVLIDKEVISAVDMGAAMYSRIETGKTEPSLSTLEKIAKALGVSLSDFFSSEDAVADVNSYDGSLMEKVKAIEALSDEEKKTVFSIVDAFAGKKKLKDALSNVLTDVK